MTSIRKIISSARAPQAIGPYSQAVRVGKTIYLSGQLGLVPESMKIIDGGVVEETRQALKNLENVLVAADSKLENVVKTTILLKDINDYKAVNEVYSQFFKSNPPARAAYQVAKLPANGNVEIEAIAIAGQVYDE